MDALNTMQEVYRPFELGVEFQFGEGWSGKKRTAKNRCATGG